MHLDDRTVYVVYDSDVALKPEVRLAMDRLGAALNRRGAHVLYAYLRPAKAGRRRAPTISSCAAGRSLASWISLRRHSGPPTPSGAPPPWHPRNPSSPSRLQTPLASSVNGCTCRHRGRYW